MACTIGTELNAIRDVAQVKPGDRVLITGAGGGLGIHGVQLARLSGAFVVAITSSEEKARLIREAGVASIPVSAFYAESPERGFLRLCFAKQDATLDEAVGRLAGFRREV